MALLTLAKLVESSSVLMAAVAAAGGGDTAPNLNGRTFLYVKNGGGGSITVTITPQNPNVLIPGKGTVVKSTPALAVAAAAERLLGPFPPELFNDASGNLVITYSGVTTVTVNALEFPQY